MATPFIRGIARFFQARLLGHIDGSVQHYGTDTSALATDESHKLGAPSGMLQTVEGYDRLLMMPYVLKIKRNIF